MEINPQTFIYFTKEKALSYGEALGLSLRFEVVKITYSSVLQ
jgi:hypothetical protein